jgi:hypothetical protein
MSQQYCKRRANMDYGLIALFVDTGARKMTTITKEPDF